ncbi:CoA-transferase [Thermodesulfobacteriota bacterium]
MNKQEYASEYSIQELMAVTLARQFKDEWWGACGAFSQIPMTGFMLAKLTHAPNMWWLSGGGGAINSEMALRDSSSDYKSISSGADAAISLLDIVSWEFGGWKKKNAFAVVGGMQVDKYGNTNMVCIGDYENMKVRGPGTVGLIFSTTFHEIFYCINHHNANLFVDKVDFISSLGRGERRREKGIKGMKGPQMVVTSRAVFDFDEKTSLMKLKSVHRDQSVEEVVALMGFTPIIPDEVPETTPPTVEEVELIRNVIDPNGVLNTVKLS